MEHHVTATECHLPYGITQCYLLPDTSEHTPPSPRPVRPLLDLPTPEGWQLKVDLGDMLHTEMVYLPADPWHGQLSPKFEPFRESVFKLKVVVLGARNS